MKEFLRHQTLTGLPKQCPKQLYRALCTIYYTANMTTLPKGTAIDANKIQPGELIHMDFFL